MPAPIITLDKKPAAATDHGGLKLVLTTARLALRKDQTNVYYHIRPAPFKAL